MDTLYQSLVTVNPVTLIAQICNLFIQLLIVKIFFLDKIKAILDQRREAADKQITEAENAKSEALAIKQTYEQNMLESKAKADDLLLTAQRTANSRSEEIIAQAQQQAAQEEKAKQFEMQKQSVLRQILTPEARDRLANIKLANPQMAEGVEMQLIQLAQSGRLQGVIDDAMLRNVLAQIAPQKREITIQRR